MAYSIPFVPTPVNACGTTTPKHTNVEAKGCAKPIQKQCSPFYFVINPWLFWAPIYSSDCDPLNPWYDSCYKPCANPWEAFFNTLFHPPRQNYCQDFNYARRRRSRAHKHDHGTHQHKHNEDHKKVPAHLGVSTCG